jgi:hypothetical protein
MDHDASRFHATTISSLRSTNAAQKAQIDRLLVEKKALEQTKTNYAKELNTALIEAHTELMERRISLNSRIMELDLKADTQAMKEKVNKSIEEYLSAGQRAWQNMLKNRTAAPDFLDLIEMEKKKDRAILEATLFANVRAEQIRLEMREKEQDLIQANIDIQKTCLIKQCKNQWETDFRRRYALEMKEAQEIAWQKGYADGKEDGYVEGLEDGRIAE